MNRIYPLIGVTALSALASSCHSDKKNNTGRYNIVYIMTDDHTIQMMSCYDNRYVETPNIDRIAADAIRFTNSFVANYYNRPDIKLQ